MLTLTGRLENIYQTPVRQNQDGTNYGGQHKLQIMGSEVMNNGQTRIVPIDITVPDPAPFQDFVGNEVSVPVRVFNSNNRIFYSYAPKQLG